MKWCLTLALLLCLYEGSLARSLPRQNGMVYYQASPMYYQYRQAPLTHRMMYLQYIQPQNPDVNGENIGGAAVSAFASGDTVATGSTFAAQAPIPADCDPSPPASQESVETVHQPEQGVSYSNDGVHSVAEAYPSVHEGPGIEVQDETINDIIPEPEHIPEVVLEETNHRKEKEMDDTEVEIQLDNSEEHHVDEPIQEEHNDAVIPPVHHPVSSVLPVTPSQVPAAYVPPKKKIRVELESPDSDEYDEPHHYYVPSKKKAAKPSSNSQKSSPGTYFPIDFGGTSGGTIAIANSYSTGEGGSASSHAVAYGNGQPASARAHSNNKKRTAQHH